MLFAYSNDSFSYNECAEKKGEDDKLKRFYFRQKKEVRSRGVVGNGKMLDTKQGKSTFVMTYAELAKTLGQLKGLLRKPLCPLEVLPFVVEYRNASIILLHSYVVCCC